MRPPEIDDVVRLIKDIPELGLCRNELGVVRSTWFAPHMAYEVEFGSHGQGFRTRALLMPELLQLQDLLFPDPDVTALLSLSA